MTISYVGGFLSGGAVDLGFPSGGHDYQTLTVEASPPSFLANDLIVIAAALEGANTIVTPFATDSRSNTYSVLAQHSDASAGNSIALVAAPMTTLLQGGDTIQLDMSASVPALCFAGVFRGVGTTLDGAAEVTNDGFASAWITPGSGTMTAEPELALAIAEIENTVTTFTDTPNSGWTDLAALSGSNCPRAFVFQYQITTSTSSVAGGGTFKSAGTASNQSYDSLLAVLQAAGGGGGGAPAAHVSRLMTLGVG